MFLSRLWMLIVCLSALTAPTVQAQPMDRVVAANYAPLMIVDGADRPGYAIEVLQEAARRCGRHVDITFLPFERAMRALQSQDHVIMPALFYGKKNNETFQWVVEIQTAKLRFSTLSDPVDTLAAARALDAIVVERGTTSDAMLTELAFDNVIRTGGPESSSRMLEAGRVDAWFQAGMTMQQFWARIDTSAPLILGDIVREVPIYLVASKALPDDVATSYRVAIDGMRADGTLRRLFQSYQPG